MNFTMIRNWVGQVGDEAFYEACDRHGIMVWQDFAMACAVYPADAAFMAGLEAEADIILFGHTHQAECFTKEGVWLMNPGACGPRGTYGVITLEKGGPECCIKSVQ